MSSYGKRMVKESLIKKLENFDPEDLKPSVSDFEAGYGIVIDEDLANEKVTIEIDQEAIPSRNEVGKVRYYTWMVKPGYQTTSDPTTEITVDEYIPMVPILKTASYDPANDTKCPNNPVLNAEANDPTIEFFIRGWFAIRDTANDTIKLFSTVSGNYSYESGVTEDNCATFKIRRTGSNGWELCDARYTREAGASVDAGTTVLLASGFSRSYDMSCSLSATAIDTDIRVRIKNALANKNYAQIAATPAVAGTYSLKCTVDANGQVSDLKWVADVVE